MKIAREEYTLLNVSKNSNFLSEKRGLQTFQYTKCTSH